MDSLSAVRVWLIILSLVECVELAQFAGGVPLSGFASNLAASADHKAETRLWSFMLVLLVISRLTAFHSPHSPAVRFQLAAVHVAEMCYFGSEYLLFSSGGETVIFTLIVLNALAFTGLALAPPLSFTLETIKAKR
jgi:hypothetical protein